MIKDTAFRVALVTNALHYTMSGLEIDIEPKVVDARGNPSSSWLSLMKTWCSWSQSSWSQQPIVSYLRA